MNRVAPGRLSFPAMIAPIADQWWLVPCVIDGQEVHAKAAIEAAQRTGRQISIHETLLDAAAESRRLRG
jgi:hypothetical protein